MAKMKPLDIVAIVLLITGGLVHLGQAFGFYAVDFLFQQAAFVGKLIYAAVGAAALYSIFAFWKLRRK